MILKTEIMSRIPTIHRNDNKNDKNPKNSLKNNQKNTNEQNPKNNKYDSPNFRSER